MKYQITGKLTLKDGQTTNYKTEIVSDPAMINVIAKTTLISDYNGRAKVYGKSDALFAEEIQVSLSEE